MAITKVCRKLRSLYIQQFLIKWKYIWFSLGGWLGIQIALIIFPLRYTEFYWMWVAMQYRFHCADIHLLMQCVNIEHARCLTAISLEKGTECLIRIRFSPAIITLYWYVFSFPVQQKLILRLVFDRISGWVISK